jgi:hypothetical protein
MMQDGSGLKVCGMNFHDWFPGLNLRSTNSMVSIELWMVL